MNAALSGIKLGQPCQMMVIMKEWGNANQGLYNPKYITSQGPPCVIHRSYLHKTYCLDHNNRHQVDPTRARTPCYHILQWTRQNTTGKHLHEQKAAPRTTRPNRDVAYVGWANGRNRFKHDCVLPMLVSGSESWPGPAQCPLSAGQERQCLLCHSCLPHSQGITASSCVATTEKIVN